MVHYDMGRGEQCASACRQTKASVLSTSNRMNTQTDSIMLNKDGKNYGSQRLNILL